MWLPLLVSTLMIVITVLTHMVGLGVLIAIMRARVDRIRPYAAIWRQMSMILVIVLALFAIHTIQIWMYAVLYYLLGEFQTFETALYFSTSSFTTVGYGEIVLDERWRLVGAIESANGFILIGWSTAFLISVISKLRAVELAWLERRDDRAEMLELTQPED